MACFAAVEAPELPPGMDPAYYALSLLRRRRLEECIKVSTHYLTLATTPKCAGSPTGATATTPPSTGFMDESMWFIQTKAMVLQSWYDDAEIEDDGVDDVLMEGEQAVVSTLHRPNTSLRAARQGTAGGGTAAGAVGRAGRLGTSAGGGRPVSSRYGYARPGTLQNRPGSVRSGPDGTAVRPVTGRFVRIGTASLRSVTGGPHINLQALNLERYAQEKPMVAKLLCDYLLYVEHKPKMALELCTAALRPVKPVTTPAIPLPSAPGVAAKLPMGVAAGAGVGPSSLPPPGKTAAVSAAQEQVGIANTNDWWWKARLAKANYQLGLLREAEKYLKAALFDSPTSTSVGAGMLAKESKAWPGGGGSGGGFQKGRAFANYNTSVVMQLGKVYLKMDQPLTALETYEAALEVNPVDHHIVLCCARLRDELHEPGTAYDLYNQVLHLDSSNIEAIACIGAHLFYERNQPELALRYYRRLLQMGLHTSEVWTNMGLCAFYTFQMELSLRCLSHALALCKEDSQRADVWYNIGHVGIGMGNMAFAERAFRLAVSADVTHAEALNNLAVLAYEKRKEKTGRRLLDTAVLVAPGLTEALYNTAVISFQAGELELSHQMVMRVLEAEPDHPEAVVLQGKLRERFLAI
ncbi:TPR repeat family protein [Leishmania donovani]|uniref:TPR repeat family protein n=2 Tax=Leishmania donovani TaxID=5661 RepID=A0A504X6Z4_LEIDO|nr:TPR repeat family protein [Leishmania donovani]